jgi:CheY-like chemotaxis protein
MVAVSDNGVGIGVAVLPHVFEPFFTTKEVGRGSGLGLSQVYGFAKESGGNVSIYSETGSGTTVKLYLPKSVEAYRDSDKPSVAFTEMASGGETVLVVDDDEMVLRTAAETVRDLGYHVLSAHNGGEALQVLKGAQKIDLLFSDIVMPGGINGVQLAIEAQRVQPSLKVLLTSGYTAAVLMDKHSLPKEFPVLGKPYRRDQLAANLREIINSHAAQNSAQ